ncbi:gliding motility-associated C-terminal domain-containing protein [Candidatus Bipolaricaulota bacterium]
MKARWTVAALITVLLLAGSVLVVWASDAELYFSSDKNGENRITQVQEGDEIWIVVIDSDEDIDCDVRDKVWTDIKVMDTKTGAHIVWKSYIDADGVDTDGDGQGDLVFRGDAEYTPHKGHWPGVSAGWLGEDFLEETGSSTTVFVSSRPFMIGTRVDFDGQGQNQSHIVGPYTTDPGGWVDPSDFEWGGYLYADGDDDDHGDDRIWVDRGQDFFISTVAGFEFPHGNAYLPPGDGVNNAQDYMLGRFENMDTLTGLYVDQNDRSDVALAMAKITDTEATLEWNREVYRDANSAAMIRVTDPDENLNCNASEMVPVFVIVNPGSWNPRLPTSANDFCMLKRYGGVKNADGDVPTVEERVPIVWYSIYDSGFDVDLASKGSNQPNARGSFYIEYPIESDGNVTSFDTASSTGVTRVMFYAQETSADSGVFELRLNDILTDLGFDSLNVRDTLVAYYVDPNDQDDVKVAMAYIEEKNHSILRFTDSGRNDKSEFWIGRDPVYIEVADANANVDSCCPEQVVVQVCDPHEVDDTEWLILDELSSNSPIFFTHTGMRLISVWDAMGIGDPMALGGYSLELDNWELEAFNEDSVYVRYNDVIYTDPDMQLLGDSDTGSAFPPEIQEVRVANDVSFAVFEVGDTQVFDGETTTMYFLDRQGNRVSGYLNSDCAFIEVVDLDQDEDQRRRERIDAFWDGDASNGQNVPFGPIDDPDNHLSCGFDDVDVHMVNDILGDTNIFDPGEWAKLYILNPRNGRWAPVDLLETGVDSGTFVSVVCVDLVNKYECAPSLGVLPGDTLLAVYNDPSNHSDVAWISIKVGIGGAMALGSQTSFVNATGEPVAAYIEGESVFVKVVDTSIADAGSLQDAVTIDGVAYDLMPVVDAEPGTFMTAALDLGLVAGDEITATYIDPSDSKDISFDTITIVASELTVDRFYATPTPFSDVVTFAYVGTGLAESFSVAVYDLAGQLVWSAEEHHVLDVDWDGRNKDGRSMANGAYIYVVLASNRDNVFTDKGQLFILR